MDVAVTFEEESLLRCGYTGAKWSCHVLPLLQTSASYDSEGRSVRREVCGGRCEKGGVRRGGVRRGCEEGGVRCEEGRCEKRCEEGRYEERKCGEGRCEEGRCEDCKV